MSWEDVLKSPDEEPNYMRGSNITWEEMRSTSAEANRKAQDTVERLEGIYSWLSEVLYSLEDMTEGSGDYRELVEQQKDVKQVMELVEEITQEVKEVVRK